MNKTFKVVFNRARGALMVANEVTSSIQKKGSKVVLATSMLAFLSSASLAATKEPLVKKVWNSEVVPTWSQEVESTTGAIDSNGLWTVTADMASGKSGVRGIDMQAGASGQLKNLSLAIATEEDSSTKIAVYGIYNIASDGSKEGAPVFGGEQLSITVDSKFTANAYAFLAQKSTNVSASKAVIKAKALQTTYGISVSKNGTAVQFLGDVDVDSQSDTSTAYGISVTGGKGTIVQFLGDVDVDSQSDTSLAYGVYQSGDNTLEIGSDGKKVSIAAKVDAENNKGKAYAVYVPQGTLQLKGETIDIDSTGTGYYAPVSSGLTPFANATIGTKETKTLTIDANNGINALGRAANKSSSVTLAAEEILINAGNVGIVAGNYATVKVNGEKKISIESGGVAIQTATSSTNAAISMTAKEISIKSKTDKGISAGKTSATIQIGSELTEKISIETEKEAIYAITAQKTVALQGKEVTLTSNSGDATVWLQGNTDNTALPTTASSLTVNANQFSVKHKNSETGRALGVFSNSKLCIDANTVIEAKKAIATRGNSVIAINENGKKTTKISGDISFETPWTPTATNNSGKLINSNVNIVFSGEDSYWEGRSYQICGDKSYTRLESVENYGAVTGFNVTLDKKATWTLTGNSFVNTLTLKDGGKIDASKAKALNVGKWDASTNAVVSDFTVRGTGNELILGTETTLSGDITMAEGSELITPLATAFTTTTEDSAVTAATKRLTVVLAKDATSATLTIPDDFKLTTEALTSMNEQYSAVTLNLANVTVLTNASAGEGTNTSEIKTDVITQSLTGKGDVKIDSGKTLTVSGENKTSEVGTIDLGTVTTEGSEATLEITNQTKVKVAEIKGDGIVLVAEKSEVEAETLSGAPKISVGDRTGEGATLSVKSLEMTGGSIFVDPLYGHSTFHVESLGSGTLNTNITAGSGGLVVFGEATQEEVTSAVNKIPALSEASAVVYVKKAAKLGSSGSVVIDPNAESAVETYAQKVVIRNGGTLVIDQKALGGETVFEGAQSIVVGSEANLGIVNASAEKISLGAGVTGEGAGTAANVSVYTDSPFLTASLASDGVITIAGTADEDGLSTVASMGIQSMIRHADAVLAETIADRTATRESGLWVSVRGERYEQDDVGSGFAADVGYGAFGADFAPTDATRLGLAIQYGHGKVKGNAFSVKNKFKDYSATLYGSADLGDTGIKLLGEVAYTQSKNDLTNTYYTGLNQDLDAKMYSGGVTAQKSFEVGSVNITPSVGIRVSRIETDAMAAGLNSIAKQKQTIVQVPIALRFSTKPVETASGWSIAPRFKAAYIPTFGDKEIEIYGSKSTVLDTSPVQGAFGVTFKKGGFAADVAVQGGVGNRGTSSIGGKIGLSYAF